MASKHIAIAAALLGIATPGHAFDPRNEAQTVMFYYAIPLDGTAKKERAHWMGMQINGTRDYQSYNMDAPLYRFNAAEEGGSAAASLLIVGGVAVGAAVLVGSRGKSAQQQTAQAPKAAPAPSDVPCPTNCPK